MVGAATLAVLHHLRPPNAVNSDGMEQHSAVKSQRAPQKAQYALSREHTIHHTRDPSITQSILPNYGTCGFLGHYLENLCRRDEIRAAFNFLDPAEKATPRHRSKLP